MSFEPPQSVQAALDQLEGSKAAALRAGTPWCDAHECERTWTPFGWACEQCAHEAAALADAEPVDEIPIPAAPVVPPVKAAPLFGVSEDPQSGAVKFTLRNEAGGRFHDEMTIGEARSLLSELAEDGHICPVCSLRAQVYKRPINGTMARSLIAMSEAWGREWGDLPSLRRLAQLHHSNQEGMLAWFGLTEEEQVRRPDGGRAGVWRVTELGEAWVNNRAKIPKYARTYGGKVLELLGSQVSIADVLPEHFDLREVMRGVVRENH